MFERLASQFKLKTSFIQFRKTATLYEIQSPNNNGKK